MHLETVILRHNYNFLKGVKTTMYGAIYKKEKKKKKKETKKETKAPSAY